MAQLKKEVVALYDDYSASVRKCRRELVSEAWFGDDWWINNSFGNNGFTFQLSKTHWFNHESQGIHFEFWIGADEASTKTLPIVLHFEPDVPDRRALGIGSRLPSNPSSKSSSTTGSITARSATSSRKRSACRKQVSPRRS